MVSYRNETTTRKRSSDAGASSSVKRRRRFQHRPAAFLLCRLFLRISSREMMYGMRRSRRIPFVYSRSRLRSRGLMARQAKILRQEAEENNLGIKVRNERFRRWETCSLCEQNYHGVVRCALGWACWKTYVGRPEADQVRRLAMQKLGNGLSAAGHHEDEMSVRKAELAMLRRLSASEYDMLVVQTNLACTYHRLGRLEEALRIQRDVYSGYLKLFGEESHKTLLSANNYAVSLLV